jgi:hypothetical protein
MLRHAIFNVKGRGPEAAGQLSKRRGTYSKYGTIALVFGSNAGTFVRYHRRRYVAHTACVARGVWCFPTGSNVLGDCLNREIEGETKAMDGADINNARNWMSASNISIRCQAMPRFLKINSKSEH